MPETAPRPHAPDNIPRWVLISQNMLIAWGVFESKQACWDFADRRGLPRDAMDTIPVGYVDLDRPPKRDELTRRIVKEWHTKGTEAMVQRLAGEDAT